MKIDESMNKLFNLEDGVIEGEIVSTEEVINDAEIEELGDEIEGDFQLARTTIKGLIDTNNTAIEAISTIAIGYENPRGFEVLGQLIKTQSDLVKELLDSHKKKKDLVVKKDEKESPILIENQNILYNGSTSDLLKSLSKK